MSVAMTISEAKQMQADDVALDGAAVRQAEAEATEAEEAAATLERSAVEGGKGSAAPAAVIEQRAVAEFARTRAARIRAAANRAKAARRVLALADVGADVETVAAEASKPSESIAAAVQKIADGHAELMRLAAEHDEKVTALVARAQQLDAEAPAPNGPRASSAHVAIMRAGITGPQGVQSGSTVVRRIGSRVAAEAAHLAASGDADGALRRMNAARHTLPPPREAHYFLGQNGVFTGDPHFFRDQLRKRELRELTPDEVEAYLDGRLDGYQA